MKRFLAIVMLLSFGVCKAQPPELLLTPSGFDAVTVNIPATDNEKLVSLTKEWAAQYNRRQRGADATRVTGNTIRITAFKKNAFNYGNKGENFFHTIKYEMDFDFAQTSYTVKFRVTEIYHDDVLLEYKVPDYFTSDGKLKEGYNTLDESLQETVNDIVQSHYNFITNYR